MQVENYVVFGFNFQILQFFDVVNYIFLDRIFDILYCYLVEEIFRKIDFEGIMNFSKNKII